MLCLPDSDLKNSPSKNLLLKVTIHHSLGTLQAGSSTYFMANLDLKICQTWCNCKGSKTSFQPLKSAL